MGCLSVFLCRARVPGARRLPRGTGSAGCGPRRLERQGPGGPQQGGQEQQRGGAARGRPLARVGAAAARLLAPQLLAQDASVRGRAQAAHVVVARPSVLAVQELVVADIRCRTRGGWGLARGGEAESI